MKSQRLGACRLGVEELEQRLVPSSFSTDTNWAGYAVATTGHNTVTSVSGSWVVPRVTGTGTSYSSAWVGIDGWNYSSYTVQQIGTDSDIINGRPEYYAWFEMYPAYSVNVPLSKVTIQPGDLISASVTFMGGTNFALKLTDVTTNKTFTTTQHLPQGNVAERSSAEWIQEAPSGNYGVLPLANFGTINFSNASATISGKTAPPGAFPSNAVNQVDIVYNSGATEAHTSALNGAGNGFSVTFVPRASGGRGHGGWAGWRDPAQTTMPSSTTNTDLQSASLQNGFQTGQARQFFPATTPATNNAVQFDTALWSRLTGPNARVSLDTTSLVGAGQEGQPGDGWFAPDGPAPGEVAPEAEAVVEQ